MIRCRVCGSEKVEVAMWVDPNTGDINDDFGSWDHVDTKWCVNCDDHTELVDDDTIRQNQSGANATVSSVPPPGR